MTACETETASEIVSETESVTASEAETESEAETVTRYRDRDRNRDRDRETAFVSETSVSRNRCRAPLGLRVIPDQSTAEGRGVPQSAATLANVLSLLSGPSGPLRRSSERPVLVWPPRVAKAVLRKGKRSCRSGLSARMWWRRERARRPALDLDRVRGCLWGGALGDALGARWENQTAPVLPDVLDVGDVSDDTQLTLASARAIAAAGGAVDPERVANALLESHRREGIRGVGAATAKALRELALGGHWALVGRKGEMAAGNGAAIRIAPLALVLDPRERIARMHIRDVARITHHSDEAYAGALAVCVAVHDGASSRTWDLQRIAAELPDSRVRDTLLEVHPSDSVADCALRFGSSGYVAESVPLALHAATRFGADGFLPMMRDILTVGGDTDSIASMAGQAWGARHGLGALPAELIARLADGDSIRHVVERFGRVVRQA